MVLRRWNSMIACRPISGQSHGKTGRRVFRSPSKIMSQPNGLKYVRVWKADSWCFRSRGIRPWLLKAGRSRSFTNGSWPVWQLLSLCNLGDRRGQNASPKKGIVSSFFVLDFFWFRSVLQMVDVFFSKPCRWLFVKHLITQKNWKKTSQKDLGSSESISTHMGGYDRIQLKSLFVPQET